MLSGALAQALVEAAVGFGVGLGFAAGFLLFVRAGLDRGVQGLASSTGLALFVISCLWLDGWIATGVLGFVAGTAALVALQSRLR